VFEAGGTVVYRFDQFEVDDREFRLTEGGAPVQVEPKVLRLLVYLIENRSRLVRKQELLDAVWPDAIVTENALTRAIVLLRKALNEDSRVPRYLETVPTVGYRFVATVTVVNGTSEVGPVADPGAVAVENGTRFRGPRRWVLLCAVLALAVVAVWGTFLFLHHGRNVLTATDTVVLADFDNSTGDPVFDGTLRRGMAVQLEQSPFLSLISDQRMQEVLKLMEKPPDTRLTTKVAQEICERTGSTAMVDGSIAALGNSYVLGLRVTNCRSGEVLAEEQTQATKKEEALTTLDAMADRMRGRMGESLATVEKYSKPWVEATTSSLDALKAYSTGEDLLAQGDAQAAVPFFRQALQLDPDFSLAYMSMSCTCAHLKPEEARQNARKAYELRSRTSERERFLIEANYYSIGSGELEKAVTTLETLKQIYPRDSVSYNDLGFVYRRLGDFPNALDNSVTAMRLAPHLSFVQNLGANYVNMNRFAEAEAAYKEADDRHFSGVERPKSEYLLAFVMGDTGRMAQLAASVSGNERGEEFMFAAEADTAAWHGKEDESRQFNRRAMDLAARNNATETVAGYQAEEALVEAELGDQTHARADARAALRLDPTPEVERIAAVALAQSGDAATAAKLADKLANTSLDTLTLRHWLPIVRGTLALQRNDANAAIQFLEPDQGIDGSSGFLAAYLRGRAYLMLHDGSRAAAEFQKFVVYHGAVRNAPWGALARLGLARAYAMQGDTAKARGAYQEFLTIWKDADPDVPILLQAKTEYAKLG
jgi:DNA-binding winged helix-turn-helix (wHTH) protein/tetratricopeptide (TPR) repeat protein